jgi:hypothetical protein
MVFKSFQRAFPKLPLGNKKSAVTHCATRQIKEAFGETLLQSSHKAFWVHKNKQAKPTFMTQTNYLIG